MSHEPVAPGCQADRGGYIASSIKSNVRELEGALIRLAAYARAVTAAAG